MNTQGKAPAKKRDPRMGLRTSATLATVFTILGHTVFGFEQSVAQVFVALAAGYSSAMFFEWVDAKACGRVPGYLGGGLKKAFDFLLSAHMTSITLSFLLYVNQRLCIHHGPLYKRHVGFIVGGHDQTSCPCRLVRKNNPGHPCGCEWTQG